MSSILILIVNLKYVLSSYLPASFLAGFISFFLGMYAHHNPTNATFFSCK